MATKKQKPNVEAVAQLVAQVANVPQEPAEPQNLTMNIVKGVITITADSTKRLHPSKSGKSQIVASTNGLKRVLFNGVIYDVAVSISVPNNPNRKFGGFEPLAK